MTPTHLATAIRMTRAVSALYMAGSLIAQCDEHLEAAIRAAEEGRTRDVTRHLDDASEILPAMSAIAVSWRVSMLTQLGSG